MDAIRTRIDPDLAVCWEDPETLRLGFERPMARIAHPTAGAQRFLGSLITGVSPHDIVSEARRVGATVGEARDLIERLSQALVTEPEAHPSPARGVRRPPLRTLIIDDGREVSALREALAASGVCEFEFEFASPELVVLVERFLEPLERSHRWLTAGIPHVVIRFTDAALHVGPLIVEGTPCNSCSTLAMVQSDAAYPVLAAQLAGQAPQSETAACGHFAAALVAMFVHDWIAGENRAHWRTAAVPVRRGRLDGAPRFSNVARHLDCGCAEQW